MTRKDQEGSERIRMNPNWRTDSIKLDIAEPNFEFLLIKNHQKGLERIKNDQK